MNKKDDNFNPWKGLDSYGESDRIYGRDEEIEVLFCRILYNSQTVIYSRSGIGKSSILKAGIFPKAKSSGFMPVSIRLQHTTDHDNPSIPYVEQVKTAISEVLYREQIALEEIVAQREDCEETLWEYLHRFRFYKIENGQQLIPLLVFDQFEEIFTLEKDKRRLEDFFSQLADLINDVMPDYLIETVPAQQKNQEVSVGSNIFNRIKGRLQSDHSQYLQGDVFRIIISLREDYLSYLERNTVNIPSLKLNRYSLLPINEKQAATIIMDPVPGLVDKDVAKLIIERVTGETDFKLDGHPRISVDSAILSLYLSRLYSKIPEGQNKITIDLVNKFGINIIQDFYEESIQSVSASSVEYLEDNLLNNEGRRENVSVYNAKHIGGLTDAELYELSEKRRILRRFAYAGDMRIEYIHDILCPIVHERRSLRKILKQQEAERQEIIQREREKRELLEQKAKADRQRYRRWLIAGCAFIAMILSTWLYHLYMYVWDCSEYYESYVLVNGWPVGVGDKLSHKDVEIRAVSYRLVKRGHRSGSHFHLVEVVGAHSELLQYDIRTPLVDLTEVGDAKAGQFVTLLRSTKFVKFSSTELSDTAKVAKMEAVDSKGHTLYVVSYFNYIEDREDAYYDGNDEAYYKWAVYTDGKGAPLQVRDNGADRMQVFENSYGQEVKYMFFDENGAPKQNDLGYYGYRVHYSRDNRQDTIRVLDPFSDEQFLEIHEHLPNMEVFRYLSSDLQPIDHNSLGYHKRVRHMDKRGNVCKKEYFGRDGHYVNDNIRSSLVTIKYDDLNRVVVTNDYDSQGKPYTQNGLFYAQREYQYIRLTNRLLRETDYRWDSDGQTMVKVRSYEVQLFGSVVEYTTADLESNEYRMMRVEHNEDEEPVSISYYGRDDRPVFDSIDNFHKHIIERSWHQHNGQNVVVHRYYDTDGTLYSHPDRRAYAIDSCVYSQRHLLLSRTCYDSDTSIVMSQGYEYKDGIEVSRYARGVNGKPIRCARWERDGLSYYKLMSVRSGADALSFVKPISEYGCDTWAYVGTDPFGMLEHRGQVFTTDYLGSQWKKETITTIYADHIPLSAKAVVYLHLLRRNSLAERLGMEDGDLLLRVGSLSYGDADFADKAVRAWAAIGMYATSLSVGRYDIKRRTWKVVDIVANATKEKLGCEIYPVYYTAEEYAEYERLLQIYNGEKSK